MKFKILLFLIFIAANIYSQETIDRIVAVVDNEIILQSELDYQAQTLAAKQKVDPNSPDFKRQVLNSMINEDLVYAQALLDTITVSDDEVNRRLDYQIDLMKQQFGSEDRIEQVYGMSIEKIKRQLRDDVKKNLIIQTLRQKKFGQVEATRHDVEDFFNTYKDSIGVIPEKVDIAHIFRNPKSSERLKAKAKAKALAILDSIKAGADFAEMAKKYSDDPGSAQHGGDLGFVKRGVFYPEFEAAAWKLKPGELSGIVESPVGYHIIQLIEKRGESIHARHILIKVKKDDEADLKTIEFLNEVRDSILKDDGTFKEYAKKYSEDKQTSVFGGELGTFYMSQLDGTLKDLVSKMKEGEISYPKRVDYGQDNYGYHIVKLESRIPEHQPSLDTDYQELKKLADEYKRQQKYNEWIEQLKKKIYWDIRL